MKIRKLALFLTLSIALTFLAGCNTDTGTLHSDGSFQVYTTTDDHSGEPGTTSDSGTTADEPVPLTGESEILTPVDTLEEIRLPDFTGLPDISLPEEFFAGNGHVRTASETTEDPDITTTAATTTVTTTTTTTTAAEASVEIGTANSHAPPTISGITNESFAEYNTIAPAYIGISSNEKCYLYNFSKALYTGVGVDGTTLPTDAEYGIHGVVSNRIVTFSFYDHTGLKTIESVYVQAMDASADNTEKFVKNSRQFSVDTSSFTNGLYRTVFRIVNDKNVVLYFYVNGSETWLCDYEKLDSQTLKLYMQRRSDLVKVLKAGNVTPANSLALDKLWYPFKSLSERERCDTQRWIDLSKTFIDDSWSDEHKLYAIQAWIRENIAYDNFVSENGHSRAVCYNDLTGRQSTYDLRAGVCFDYANIIVIMCRAHGIPAITIGAKSINHVWNAVYINGRWIEYDACLSEQYHVGKDTDTRIKSGEPLYGGFFSVAPNNTSTRKMPEDATANQYLQYDSLYLY